MAVKNSDQSEIIANIAVNFSDEDVIKNLLKSVTKEKIINLLNINV